ncbi:MAG: glycosyltransferase family 9 protein [Methylacidiphilales bacterium]|nr:glycosyltransferase family 9 protein [Candidatus Methylacidiphilales bacterium]
MIDALKALLRTHSSTAKIYVRVRSCYWRIYDRLFFLWVSAKLGFPRSILTYGAAPGDNLLCSAVAHEMKRRGKRCMVVSSNYPELFDGNQDVDKVIRRDDPRMTILRKYGLEKELEYASVDPGHTRSANPSEHIIAAMCRIAGIRGSIALKPYFFLAQDELQFGRFFQNQVAIQSSGRGAQYYMLNKEWFPERFQQVVNHFLGRIPFVQIGSMQDPPLTGCLDLRGKTSIRQSAAILANSVAFVGQVGFLMHLARAVECPSVIVYGGRELPSQSGYSCNENLCRRPECSPCWLWNDCEHDRICMKDIRVDEVCDALERLLGNRKTPPPADMATITNDGNEHA